MKSDLSGQVSLVTGSARGIGQAIADRLAANGSIVYYSDLKLEDAQAAAAASPNGRAVKLDITKRVYIDSALEHIQIGRAHV